MKQSPLSSASNLLSIFEGGRSPDCWREQLSRQVEWTSATRRSSGWIEDLTDVELELCGQPLLGNTLAALMSRNAGSNTVAVESTASRATFRESTHTGKHESQTAADVNGRKSFTSLPDKVPQPKRAVAAVKRSSTDSSTETVFQLQPQADAALLRRIAGEMREFSNDRADLGTSNTNGKQNSAQLNNTAVRLKQHQAQPSTLAGRGFNSAVASTPPTPLAQAELPTLVQRAVRRIKTTFGRESSITRNLSAAAELGEAKGVDSRSLTEHWSMPIFGPTVSTRLLIRLTNSDREADHVEDTVGESLPRRSESQAPSTRRAEQPQDLTASIAQTTHSPVPAAAPAIAPPSITPSLPPLHSQKMDDVLAPVAAATAQRQARIEEDIARGDEDLPLLAERMERILKQEARRHGIDV